MTIDRNYREEALSTRRAAREKLKALREARRSAKVRPTAITPRADQGGGQDNRIAPESFFSIETARPLPRSENGEVEDITGDPLAPAAEMPADRLVADGNIPVEEPASDNADPSVEAVGERNTPVASEAETSEALDTRAFSELVGEPAPITPLETARVDPECDLFALPGAGAGIVWMFQQCGIHSLADLADADARELSAKLGVVGHILNIQPWITFATEARQPTHS